MIRTLVFLACILLAGCTHDPSPEEEVEAWHAGRMDELRQPDGWLSLVGLYWLEDGPNHFGSDSVNDLIFPDGAPARMGTFLVDDGSVRAVIAEGVEVSSGGRPVTEMVMQTSADDEAEPTPMSWGSLTWILIERDGRFAIRLKDSESAARASFAGIERFPFSADWRLEALWEPYEPIRTIDVPTVMGTVSPQPSPGRIIFQVDGLAHSLEVTGLPGDAQYFVIFADETNGSETYPAGRYLWIDAPAGRDNVVVDFNKAYNPPCVFTPYATCPFPPPQNRLGIRIEAGEMNYENGIQTADRRDDAAPLTQTTSTP